MPPGVRKLALTLHVTTSVAWLGAVAAFLALAVAGPVGGSPPTVRAAYLITWAVIVPLCLASLLTSVAQGLDTTWGQVRHWWVLVKLVLTVLTTALLLLHTQPIGHLGRVAAQGEPFAGLDGMQVQLVADAAAASVVLLGATVLAIYKARGLTRFGHRKA